MKKLLIDIKGSAYTLSKIVGILLFLFIFMGVPSADTYYQLDNSVENGATQAESVSVTVSGNSIIF